MTKARSAALRRDISRLAAEIYRKNSKLDDAGKKELSFIHKHLRKAAKAIQKSVGKAKPVRKAGKKSPVPTPGRRRPGQGSPAKARPPVRAQGDV